MHTYWALVSTGIGAIMCVTIQADTPYNATQMLKAMYGDKLITECANQQ